MCNLNAHQLFYERYVVIPLPKGEISIVKSYRIIEREKSEPENLLLRFMVLFCVTINFSCLEEDYASVCKKICKFADFLLSQLSLPKIVGY
jgi:hypothetical protein